MAQESEDFQVIDTGYDFEKQILLDKVRALLSWLFQYYWLTLFWVLACLM